MSSRLPAACMAGGMLIAAAVTSSCGDDVTAATKPAPRTSAGAAAKQRALIRRTVRRAKREATGGSAVRTCAYITPEGQARAIQAYGQRYHTPLATCPQMVRFARKREGSYMSDARRATIRSIMVKGSRAEVVFEGPKMHGYGGLVGVLMRKQGSRWRADDTDFVPYGTGE